MTGIKRRGKQAHALRPGQPAKGEYRLITPSPALLFVHVVHSTRGHGVRRPGGGCRHGYGVRYWAVLRPGMHADRRAQSLGSRVRRLRVFFSSEAPHERLRRGRIGLLGFFPSLVRPANQWTSTPLFCLPLTPFAALRAAPAGGRAMAAARVRTAQAHPRRAATAPIASAVLTEVLRRRQVAAAPRPAHLFCMTRWRWQGRSCAAGG